MISYTRPVELVHYLLHFFAQKKRRGERGLVHNLLTVSYPIPSEFLCRKLHVTPQSRTCCSPWNVLQVIFVLFTVGAMICLMWFTVILKTSLESMKRRVVTCKYTVVLQIYIRRGNLTYHDHES